MKLRRMTAAVLAAVMCLGGTAQAAGSADGRLTQVTQKVKATLSVPDSFTQFYGEPRETYLGTFWELNWTGEEDDGTLSVTATGDGKILSMYRSGGAPAVRSSRFDPHFPALDRAQAREKAQAFLNKVLTPGETVNFSSDAAPLSPSSESCSFYGEIRLNGLPSPLTFRVRVRLSDGAVTSFSREDVSGYVGQVPEARSAISRADAAAKLKTVLKLRLEYVRSGEKAVLRYLPEPRDDYYVDAASGELVNLTELRRKLDQAAAGGSNNAMDSAAPEAAPTEKNEAGAALTQEELAGIAKLEGVLSAEALDQAARKWTQLGLEGFERSAANFTVDRESGAVSVRLAYAKKAQDKVFRRYVTLDAKTGELLEVYGYKPYDPEAQASLTQEAAQAGAESFLRALWPEQFARTQLYHLDPAEKGNAVFSFQFAQKVNGYFFPENALSVRVDGEDGTILSVSRSFDEKVVFDSADHLISPESAVTAWAGGYPMELSYLAVPVRLDLLGPEAEPLLNAGMSYFNALKPGYGLSWGETGYSGVDAKTGALVEPEKFSSGTVTYSDIRGHWAEAALAQLAEYRVGWMGGKAEPDAPLTQLDLLSLLASSNGYLFDPETEKADDLYQYAYRQGLLTREERADEKRVSRLEMVRLLLDALGYRTAANLPGIYRCDFTDAGELSGSALGYAALAQGLGLISGDGSGRFAPDSGTTRAEAAVMLWRYMKR